MKAIILALTLSACTNTQLTNAAQAHADWVCRNSLAVSVAANAVIRNADSIKDANAREAAVAIARADLEIVARCE